MKFIDRDFTWGNGPSSHTGGGWKTVNAYDLEVESGAGVDSITNGRVAEINSPSQSGHLYGTSMLINSNQGEPDIFYSNLSSVVVRVGERVHVGQKLGKVAKAPNNAQSYLHLATKFGTDIKSLIDSEGNILAANSSSSNNSSGGDIAAGAAAAGAGLSGGKDKKNSGDDDGAGFSSSNIMKNVYSTLAKGLVPLGMASAISGLAEEVKRMKKLMK